MPALCSGGRLFCTDVWKLSIAEGAVVTILSGLCCDTLLWELPLAHRRLARGWPHGRGTPHACGQAVGDQGLCMQWNRRCLTAVRSAGARLWQAGSFRDVAPHSVAACDAVGHAALALVRTYARASCHSTCCASAPHPLPASNYSGGGSGILGKRVWSPCNGSRQRYAWLVVPLCVVCSAAMCTSFTNLRYVETQTRQEVAFVVHSVATGHAMFVFDVRCY